MPELFACAGEPSGDALLAAVLHELMPMMPGLRLRGLGGPLAQREGFPACPGFETAAVNGITDVLKRAPALLRLRHNLLAELTRSRPDMALLVDAPGLNLPLLKRCRALGIPVLYLAPPQIWAWRFRRPPDVRGVRLQVLYPFEKAVWERAGAEVTQGHFLGSTIPARPDADILCLCPGSRLPVFRRNLQPFLELARRTLVLRPELRAVLLVPPSLRAAADRADLDRMTVSESPGETWTRTALAVAHPGTVTMQLAWRRIPTLVFGTVDTLTWLGGKIAIQAPFLAMPNLLAGRQAVPEYVIHSGRIRTPLLRRLARMLARLSAPDVPWAEFAGAEDGARRAATTCRELLGT